VADVLAFGRDITGDFTLAESREWLCTNGIGGFASGTVAGSLARRYHGLLVAALAPPLGRTLLAAKLEETLTYAGVIWELGTNRWQSGAVAPEGHRFIERFCLESGVPVWTYACADALLEKRVWMEQGANTTYVQYRLLRGFDPGALEIKALVNYRDHHATTRADGWRMQVEAAPGGLVVTAFDGARQLRLIAEGARAEPSHEWYRGYELRREAERGLDHYDDHLDAGTFHASVAPGASVTVVLSAEPEPALDGEAAWRRQDRYAAATLARWEKAATEAARPPAWVPQLVLAADQFIVRRPLPDSPEGLSVIAGYPWFEDWGRDTMISLPGLALATGRPEVARRVLATFARFIDCGMLPNRFPDGAAKPEYNTADAALWYIEAVRAYHAATEDDAFLAQLYPALTDIIGWHRKGTRYGIGQDQADGLLHSGEAGVQLTWMDAKVGDWVVTPRTGKPVEINALWHNALRAMAVFARRLKRSPGEWEAEAARVAAGFERFWNEAEGCCFDVLDGPSGHDAAVRPNQIFAVSLPSSPLSPDRQRNVVEVCAKRLLTSFGLRSLDPRHPDYKGQYRGGTRERDGAYHQGTVWGWLLGPFALAHFKVYGDRGAAQALLEPLGWHVGAYGVGSLGEVFDGEPPFAPGGCPAQAWTVAETLRAWTELVGGARRRPR
jgi:predicted glycogen debranching enzyme